MPHRYLRTATAAALITGALASGAFATTKGLNQIVTPDVQPTGQFSISYQQQDPQIGNQNQVQLELGVCKEFEIAYFHGFSPPFEVLNAEVGLVDKRPWLLSTGFLGWTSNGTAAQPFLEGGYYEGKIELVAGAVDADIQNVDGTGLMRQDQAVLGAAYQATPRLLVQTDYQAGSGNSSTIGFTYAVTPAVTVNPAIYVTNSSPHNVLGYAVVTWNLTAWK
jgi:hypothetical protein